MSQPTPSQRLDLSELHARYRGPLLAYFQRRGATTTEAEDLTQDVFLRLTRLPEAQSIEDADRFIFTVAVNLLRDRARRGRAQFSRLHTPLDEAEPSFTAEPLVERLEPERILLSREVLSRVRRVLQNVSPRTRDIFLLFRLEGMSQREIAGLHGISVSAVEKHVAQALRLLATELTRL